VSFIISGGRSLSTRSEIQERLGPQLAANAVLFTGLALHLSMFAWGH
jgi:hypothetical protein